MENETVVTDGILERGSVDADGNAVIPKGVTDIDNEAFLNCTSLVSATIPEGVRSIGGSAFEGCAALRSLALPKSLQSIDEDALLGCPHLSEITYAGTILDWDSRYDDLADFDDEKSYDRKALLRREAVTICGKEFAVCDSLKALHRSRTFSVQDLLALHKTAFTLQLNTKRGGGATKSE